MGCAKLGKSLYAIIGCNFLLIGVESKRTDVKNDLKLLLYQQPNLFDDYHQVFDEKLVTYKINSKFYIKFNQGKKGPFRKEL